MTSVTSTSFDLSVVIPAYNEAKRLGPTLESIVAYLSERAARASLLAPDSSAAFEVRTFEVIVVDDGSSDDTRALAEAFGAPVRVVALPENRGKGAAVRAGVQAAQGAVILFSDADLSTPITEWERFRAVLADGADIVIGSRGLADSNIEIRQPWFRERMGKTFNWLLRRLLPLRFPDTQCGFKAFRTPVAQALFRAGRTEGFAFDAEILFLAERAGYRVEQLPITWRNSPDSRVAPLRHSAQMLRDLVGIRVRAATNGYELARAGNAGNATANVPADDGAVAGPGGRSAT